MKKLMIAAAVAAMVGGAFADEEASCTTPCAWAYQVKVIVKTTTTASLSNATTCTGGCYRKPTYRRYIGYFFGTTTKSTDVCNAGCNCISFEDTLTSRIAMWNFDTKEAVTPIATLRLADRIGKDSTDTCEIVFSTIFYGTDAEGTDVKTELVFAGFGNVAKMASGKPAIKFANGYCAGTVPGSCISCDKVCGVVDPDTCVVVPANIWTICGESITSYVTAAYGKWKMQWDGQMASRITNQKTVMGDEEDIDTDTFIDKGAKNFTPAGYNTGVAKIIAVLFEDNREVEP